MLGPNGTGKTTTIEILEGFRIASDGEMRVLGVDPTRGDEPWRARVGVVLQSWRDHARWTPRDLLTHLGRCYVPHSTPERTRPYDVEELIAMVGIEEQAEQKIRTLSVTREAEVRWSRNGEQFVHSTPDATGFVRSLLAQHDYVADLEVRRATLEDTYIAMVQQHETGHADQAAIAFEEMKR